jgi:carboxylesterase
MKGMEERIYKSAEPFLLPGNGENESTAVLMVHGFTGSPSEFRRAGYFLNEMGYTVNAIRLPGHGTCPEDMNRTSWTDWYDHVLQSYEEMKAKSYEKLIVMGHSMGGLLSLKLACERQVDGIISLATPIHLTNRKTMLAYWLQYWIPYIEKRSTPPLAENNRLDEAWSYRKTPTRCVVSLRKLLKMVKQMLPLVQAPIYIGQGLQDRVVRHHSAAYIHERVSSSHKAIKLYPQTSHGMLLDQERDQVYRDIFQFISSLGQPVHEELDDTVLDKQTLAYL